MCQSNAVRRKNVPDRLAKTCCNYYNDGVGVKRFFAPNIFISEQKTV